VLESAAGTAGCGFVSELNPVLMVGRLDCLRRQKAWIDLAATFRDLICCWDAHTIDAKIEMAN